MEEKIENELDRLGCEPKWRSNYWLIKCPKHKDRSPSAQCFPDGWIACHAGCGRFHINSLGKNVVPFRGENEEHRAKREKEEKVKRVTSLTFGWTLNLLRKTSRGSRRRS